MLDPKNPTTADSAVVIGVIVVALTLIWMVYDSVVTTKRKKNHNIFDETDIFN
jgi:hypothetical protein